MLHFSDLTNETVIAKSEVMEAETILKNGRSLKSQMSRGIFFMTIGFLLLAFSPVLNAQSKFGLQTGIGYDFENSDIGNYNFGVFLKVPLSTHWTFEPSLNLFPLGSETTTKEDKTWSVYSASLKRDITYTSHTTTRTKIDAMSVNMPLFLAYRFSLSDKLGLQLGIGPYFNYALSGTVTESRTSKLHSTYDNKTQTKTDKMEIEAEDKLSYGGMLRAGLLINNKISANIEYVGYDSVSEKAFGSKAFMLRLGYQF